MKQSKTFETTYTRYPFAPLVALGVAIAAALKPSGGKTRTATQDNHRVVGGRQHAAA